MRGGLPAIANVLKAWALVLGVCAFLGALGFAAGGYRLLSILVFCALLLAGGAHWYSDRVALGLVGARELPVGEAPALHSTVERLAAVAGVLKPRLYLIPDGHPRALAAGRGPRASALAVSAGLVSALTPAELEGVIAHELAHVRNRDIVVQTAAVGLADALVRLEQANDLVHFEGSPATEPLYTINPFAEEGLAGLFASHPPISERVRRLRALDPGWRDRLRAA